MSDNAAPLPELDKKQMADEARAVMSNPAFNRAFQDMIDGINSTMVDLPIDDTNGRLAQSYLMTAAGMFKVALTERINDWQLVYDEYTQAQRAKLDEQEK